MPKSSHKIFSDALIKQEFNDALIEQEYMGIWYINKECMGI